MDREFNTVQHHCFFQSVLNYVDLPLSISYYRLLCKMLFRINFCINKERPIITAFAVGAQLSCGSRFQHRQYPF